MTKPSAVIMLATSSSQNVGTDLEGSARARKDVIAELAEDGFLFLSEYGGFFFSRFEAAILRLFWQ